MNSPYKGKFRVSQPYKGDNHDGLDLVGVDSKLIHSTICGKVVYAGWENPANHKQGFGMYVKIQRLDSDEVYYFGHLSEINVRIGDTVTVGQIIGTEGNTGHSTGSHLHYCMRMGGRRGMHRDISAISGIPNAKGTYCAENDIPVVNVKFGTRGEATKWVQYKLQRLGYDIGKCGVDGIAGNDTVRAIREFQAANSLVVDGIAGKKTCAKLVGLGV